MTISVKQSIELKKRVDKLVKAEVKNAQKGLDKIQIRNYQEDLRVARVRYHEYVEVLLTLPNSYPPELKP